MNNKINLKVWNDPVRELCPYNVGELPKYAKIEDNLIVIGNCTLIVFTENGLHSYCKEFDIDDEAEAYVNGTEFNLANLTDFEQMD